MDSREMMYRIRHKRTGKFLSEFGRMLLVRTFLPDLYEVESHLSKKGRHWVMRYAVDLIMRRAEAKFPGEFEVVSYTETIVN